MKIPHWHQILVIFMIYALLSRNFDVRIYALFPQIFGNWKVDSADFFTFRMYAKELGFVILAAAFQALPIPSPAIAWRARLLSGDPCHIILPGEIAFSVPWPWRSSIWQTLPLPCIPSPSEVLPFAILRWIYLCKKLVKFESNGSKAGFRCFLRVKYLAFCNSAESRACSFPKTCLVFQSPHLQLCPSALLPFAQRAEHSAHSGELSLFLLMTQFLPDTFISDNPTSCLAFSLCPSELLPFAQRACICPF